MLHTDYSAELLRGLTCKAPFLESGRHSCQAWRAIRKVKGKIIIHSLTYSLLRQQLVNASTLNPEALNELCPSGGFVDLAISSEDKNLLSHIKLIAHLTWLNTFRTFKGLLHSDS